MLPCSSGTDALILSLLALNIGKGDIIFCPSFYISATAEAILIVGATPVFVDVERILIIFAIKAFLMLLRNVKKNLNIKAIMPVDFMDYLANFDKINKLLNHLI